MAKINKGKHVLSGRSHWRTQTFSLTAPTATSVQLVGSFTDWREKPITMHKSADGMWQTRVELASGAHPYRFIVDGQWHDDPECSLRQPNPYGGHNALRQVV